MRHRGWHGEKERHSIAGHGSRCRKTNVFSVIGTIKDYNEIYSLRNNGMLDSPGVRSNTLEKLKLQNGSDYINALGNLLAYKVFNDYESKWCFYSDDEKDKENCDYYNILTTINDMLTYKEKVNLLSDILVLKRGDIVLDFMDIYGDSGSDIKELAYDIALQAGAEFLSILLFNKTKQKNPRLSSLNDDDIAYILDSINLIFKVSGTDEVLTDEVLGIYQSEYLREKYNYPSLLKNLHDLYEKIRKERFGVDDIPQSQVMRKIYMEQPFVDDVILAQKFLKKHPEDIGMMYIASAIKEVTTRHSNGNFRKTYMTPYLTYTLFGNDIYYGYYLCVDKLKELNPSMSVDNIHKKLYNDITSYIGFILTINNTVKSHEQMNEMAKNIGTLLYYFYDMTGNSEYLDVYGLYEKKRLIPSNVVEGLRIGVYSTLYKFGEISEEELRKIVEE